MHRDRSHAPPLEHLSLAKHLTAERTTEEFVAGKGVMTRWQRIRRANRWFASSHQAERPATCAAVREAERLGDRMKPPSPLSSRQ
jgi:hypothetical protein